MEVQIQLEVDQYISYPLEEVSIDFDVLGPSDSGGNRVDVLLAAARRENLDNRVAALKIGGLSAAIVDVEAYTMEFACTPCSRPRGGNGGHHHRRRDHDPACASRGPNSLYPGAGLGGHQLIEDEVVVVFNW